MSRRLFWVDLVNFEFWEFKVEPEEEKETQSSEMYDAKYNFTTSRGVFVMQRYVSRVSEDTFVPVFLGQKQRAYPRSG